MIWRLGTYVWTACAACWFVMAYVTGLPEPLLVGLGCLAVAGLSLSAE